MKRGAALIGMMSSIFVVDKNWETIASIMEGDKRPSVCGKRSTTSECQGALWCELIDRFLP